MTDIAHGPALNGQGLDMAIEYARAALAALLRVPVGGDGAAHPGPGSCYLGDGPHYLTMIADARALLGVLLEHRLAVAAERTGEWDPAAIAAVRADRNEAIAVHAALLYWLQADDPAWPGVAMTVGRLSYDRYRDAWLDAEAPDPDDLDAACDLLRRAASSVEADERTVRYLVLALRDRHRLQACPADTRALMIWGERLLTFPGAGSADPESLGSLRLTVSSRSWCGHADGTGVRQRARAC